MKKFIFRFPTTKKNKAIGAALLESARICMETAEKFGKVNGSYTEYGVSLIQSSCDLWNRAARRFGFRNLADMEEYRQRHGHI